MKNTPFNQSFFPLSRPSLVALAMIMGAAVASAQIVSNYNLRIDTSATNNTFEFTDAAGRVYEIGSATDVEFAYHPNSSAPAVSFRAHYLRPVGSNALRRNWDTEQIVRNAPQGERTVIEGRLGNRNVDTGIFEYNFLSVTQTGPTLAPFAGNVQTTTATATPATAGLAITSGTTYNFQVDYNPTTGFTYNFVGGSGPITNNNRDSSGNLRSFNSAILRGIISESSGGGNKGLDIFDLEQSVGGSPFTHLNINTNSLLDPALDPVAANALRLRASATDGEKGYAELSGVTQDSTFSIRGKVIYTFSTSPNPGQSVINWQIKFGENLQLVPEPTAAGSLLALAAASFTVLGRRPRR